MSSGPVLERWGRDQSGDEAVFEIIRRSASFAYAHFAVGIEILPYQLVGVIIDVDGNERGIRRVQLPNMKVETVVYHVDSLAKALVKISLGLDLPNSRVGLGVQLGGTVDTRTGVVLLLQNNPDDPAMTRNHPAYRWRNEELVELIRDKSRCTTVLENDANAYAAYEQKRGVGRKTGSFAIILIRDGIGGAVVVDHKLVPIPFEFGHLIVWPDGGRKCDCGRIGCVESQAGRRAIRAVVSELTNVDPGRIESIQLAADYVNSSEGRDGLEAFRKAGKSIARGIGHILTLFNPSHIVIYGPEALIGSSRGNTAANVFMEEVGTFGKYVFPAIQHCRLVTELDPERPVRGARGAQGAALIALHRHFFVPLRPR